MKDIVGVMLGNNSSMKLGLSALLFFGILILALSVHVQDGLAQSIQDINLTGSWHADDGGTYYLRNIAKDLWWLGSAATTMEVHFLTF